MLKTMEINCPARVTLFLNNLGLDEGNKPKFKLVNQTIDIYDKINIEDTRSECENNIKINSNSKNIPLNHENICYKACKLFFEYTGIKHSGIKIFIDKQIPVSMGFGGAASDAAGVLLGLNKYYDSNLTERELLFLAMQLGEEVPYFIISGYAYIKNKINVQILHDNPYNYYLIIKPNIKLNKRELIEKIGNSKIIEKSRYNQTLNNDFLTFMPDEVLRLKKFLEMYPSASYSLLGSGPSYFIPMIDNSITSKMIRVLHQEFPEYKLYNCKNTSGHRIFVKYPIGVDFKKMN